MGLYDDGRRKILFTTANTKEVYKQLQETPYLEFTCSNKEGNWLRLSGEAIFTKDLEIKKKVMESSPGVKMLYQSPDNPIFEVFYVEHGQASIHEFGGKPIHEITF